MCRGVCVCDRERRGTQKKRPNAQAHLADVGDERDFQLPQAALGARSLGPSEMAEVTIGADRCDLGADRLKVGAGLGERDELGRAHKRTLRCVRDLGGLGCVCKEERAADQNANSARRREAHCIARQQLLLLTSRTDRRPTPFVRRGLRVHDQIMNAGCVQAAAKGALRAHTRTRHWVTAAQENGALLTHQ